jgi:hypothetical protein
MIKRDIFLTHTPSLQWIHKAQNVVRNYDNYTEKRFNVNAKHIINTEK